MRDVLQPIFNDVPFKKIKVPDNLYSFMMDEYKTLVFDQKDQEVTFDKIYQTYTSGGISVKGSREPFCLKTDISKELYDMCYHEITPMIEDWSGQELEMTWAYGIRNYVRDSILHLHRDRIETHIISCIIYVDQQSEENWALDFFDHEHNHHKVLFEPGDMLFYESLCLHGRIDPFQGDYYRNMYFHWKPIDWWYDDLYDLRTDFRDATEFRNYYGQEYLYNREERVIPRTL